MIITRHVGINRFGKHERPVTIQDDDGRLFDTVLYFDKAPSVPNIEAAAIEYVNKIKASENIPPDNTIQVSEVESVLRNKGLLGTTEKWDDWKSKPIQSKLISKEDKK